MKTDNQLRGIIRWSGIQPIQAPNANIRKYHIDDLLVIAFQWHDRKYGDRIYIRYVYRQENVLPVSTGDWISWYPAHKCRSYKKCHGIVKEILPDNMLLVGYQINICGRFRWRHIKIGDWQVCEKGKRSCPNTSQSSSSRVMITSS